MPTKKIRPIDKAAKESFSWVTKTYVFINKTKIKTWQAIFIIAFVAGVTTALMWSLSFGWHPATEAKSLNPELIGESISIQKEFSNDIEFFPFEDTKNISFLGLNGDVNINSENSLIRIILVDDQGGEYLAYEVYYLTAQSNSFSLQNECEETCAIDSIVPASIRIQVEDASVFIDNIFIGDQVNQRKAQQVEKVKIQKVKNKIKEQRADWMAGETSVSKMTYKQKKELFRDENGELPEKLPNLQEMEYYIAGTIKKAGIDLEVQTTINEESSSLPVKWDWRDVHGENWLTSVKSQGGGGTCWAHADIATMESRINLYYNDHLDVDLSEQLLVDCINRADGDMSVFTDMYDCTNHDRSFCQMKNVGVSDELCHPYEGRNITSAASPVQYCSSDHTCDDWQDRLWKITNYQVNDIPPSYNPSINTTDYYISKDISKEDIKKILIKNGPLLVGYSPWAHDMLLVGYEEDLSDWKEVERCEGICDPTQGCIDMPVCDSGNEDKEIEYCYNGRLDFVRSDYKPSQNVKMICKAGAPGFYNGEYLTPYRWDISSTLCRGKCVDNECVDSSEYILHEGKVDCGSRAVGGLMKTKFEYHPGNGEVKWVFKNSWGANWGDDGYVSIAAPVSQFSHIKYLFGPIIPPAGQSYDIKCEDKDNDSYCNWGISEDMPSTCPDYCKAEKDCDDSNSSLGTYDSNYNCSHLFNPMFSDWDGDGEDTLGLYDSISGDVYIKNSIKKSLINGSVDVELNLGEVNSNWIPVSGDWDGDGIDTISLFDPEVNRFHIKNSLNEERVDYRFIWGSAKFNWIPISGDWDGDGIDTVGLYDPLRGVFQLKNSINNILNVKSENIFLKLGEIDSSWIPISGDWDGDGIDTVGLYDSETSRFHIKDSFDGDTVDYRFIYGNSSVKWRPISGDWSGDGVDNVGVYDPVRDLLRLRGL